MKLICKHGKAKLIIENGENVIVQTNGMFEFKNSSIEVEVGGVITFQPETNLYFNGSSGLTQVPLGFNKTEETSQPMKYIDENAFQAGCQNGNGTDLKSDVTSIR